MLVYNVNVIFSQRNSFITPLGIWLRKIPQHGVVYRIDGNRASFASQTVLDFAKSPHSNGTYVMWFAWFDK
jgi:hypothetical protein